MHVSYVCTCMLCVLIACTLSTLLFGQNNLVRKYEKKPVLSFKFA